jgi:hypothetical protein
VAPADLSVTRSSDATGPSRGLRLGQHCGAEQATGAALSRRAGSQRGGLCWRRSHVYGFAPPAVPAAGRCAARKRAYPRPGRFTTSGRRKTT